jgi:predicted aspartyl protease
MFILLFLLIFSPEGRCAEIVLFETKLQPPLDAILLPVTIKGKTYRFLFDTGATLTVFDKSLEYLLGEPLNIKQETETSTGKMLLSYYNPIDVMLGKLNLKTKLPFMTADLKFLGKVLGQEFQGVIGMNFIHQYIWKIDFDEKIIQILSSNSNLTPDNHDTFVDIHPTPRLVPVIMIDLMENDVPFIIDTGATGSGRLTKDVIDLMIEKKLVRDVASDTVVSVSGIPRKRRVRVNHFKVGPLEYSGLLMHESQQNAIGLRFLKRHRFILDFPNKKLYLGKGLYSFVLDREDKSGIKIINDKGQIVIGFVDERGPAAVIGFKKGDVIKSINKMPVDGNDLLRIRNILKGKNGEKILIKIDRHGKSIEVHLILKKGYDHL